jgi:hypothetical protein
MTMEERLEGGEVRGRREGWRWREDRSIDG